MLSRLARFEMRRLAILITIIVVMIGGPRMLVRGRSVMVFGMLVLEVGVRVQRGPLEGGAGEGKAGHDGDQPLHPASVWKQ